MQISQQLSSFIARNINSFVFPETLAEPTLESERCHFFSRGMLLFYPRLECSTCNQTHFEFHFHPDQEITTVQCPGCNEQYTPKLTIQGFNTVKCKGERRIMNRHAEQYTDIELEEELYHDCESTDFTETVDYLGVDQILFKLTKLMLSQPLLLMSSMELIKKQPTLAYNMKLMFDHSFDDTMIQIMFSFFQQAHIEGSRTEGIKHSVGDILPVDASLPDEKVIVVEQQKDLIMNPEEEKKIHYEKLTTYVFEDRRKGDNIVSLRTYNGDELIKDSKLKGFIFFRDQKTFFEKVIHYRQLFHCDVHELVVTHRLPDMCEEVPLCRLIKDDDNRKYFGEPYVNEEVNSCMYCTEPLKIYDTQCYACNAPVLNQKNEIHVILNPIDKYGYRYSVEMEECKFEMVTPGGGLWITQANTLEELWPPNPFSFSELSFYFEQLEVQLQKHGYKFNKVKVSGPCMLNLYMPNERWEYVVDRELDYLNTPKLQAHIRDLKKEYESKQSNWDYYRAAVDYQFPKPPVLQDYEDTAMVTEAVKQLKIREKE